LAKRARKAPKKGARHDEYDHRRLDFTDYEPDPALEQEFFGNFRPSERDFSRSKRTDGRYCSEGEFSRSGRGPKGWVPNLAGLRRTLSSRPVWPGKTRVAGQNRPVAPMSRAPEVTTGDRDALERARCRKPSDRGGIDRIGPSNVSHRLACSEAL
jgi:hypothetical protein